MVVLFNLHCARLSPIALYPLSTHHSGSTGVMSIRGGAPKGKDVGLAITSLSGVRDLSPCRHDNGGSCRLPEKRLRPRRKSTPSVQAGDVKDSLRQQSGGSLLSWEEKGRGGERKHMELKTFYIDSKSLIQDRDRRRDKRKKSQCLPLQLINSLPSKGRHRLNSGWRWSYT